MHVVQMLAEQCVDFGAREIVQFDVHVENCAMAAKASTYMPTRVFSLLNGQE